MNAGGDAARAAGFLRGLVLGLLAGAVLALAIALASARCSRSEPTAAEQAREVIEDNYFREVDPRPLEGSSVRGMVGELRKHYDDRFSHYFGPKQLEELNAATSGEFSGVGLTVSEVKRGLRVASVLDNTPRAGRRDQGGRPDRRRGRRVDRRQARRGRPRPRSRVRRAPRSRSRVVPVERRRATRHRARARRGAACRPSTAKLIRWRHPTATQGRVRPLRDLLRGRPRRAARDDRAPLPRGRRGPAARPARQRRRTAERGGALGGDLRRGRRGGLHLDPRRGRPGLPGGGRGARSASRRWS